MISDVSKVQHTTPIAEVNTAAKTDAKNKIKKASYDTLQTSQEYQQKVKKLKEYNEAQQAEFKNKILSMVVGQTDSYNLILFGEKLQVSAEESQKAKEAISEGGEYSIDCVATRIMDMAKALSGGDSSKISLLRDAVEQGFALAGKEFKQDMPQITHDTYDEVMSRFDDWEREASGAAEK